MPDSSIDADEILYRRIPPGTDWFEPPDRISSLNFKLRPGETGVSVYRARLVDVQGVLSKPGAIRGSGVAQAVAGHVRDARDSQDNPLNLDVLPVNDENDPGHAEIRGQLLHDKPRVAAKALRKLFDIIVPPATP